MELSDIILALVGVLTTVIGGVVKSVVKDIKNIEDRLITCQSELPLQYVLKDDYREDIEELKTIIITQGRKTDHLIEKIFEKLEKKVDK